MNTPDPKPRPRRFTVEEYLAFDNASPERHEYRDGLVFRVNDPDGLPLESLDLPAAPSEPVADHSGRILGNAIALIRCRLPPSAELYPLGLVDRRRMSGGAESDDVGIAISRGTPAAGPIAVLSVMSPNTPTSGLPTSYLDVPTLELYMFAWHDTARIDFYQRLPDGFWRFGAFKGIDAVARLEPLGIELPLKLLYEGVEFPPEEDDEADTGRHSEP
jgi:hypothetical protein